jgi:ribosome-binding protein aMBF1 (putative translation factor)
MDPNVQDWDPLVLRKDTSKDPKSTKKPTISRPASVAKVSHDDDGTEVLTLKTVSREMAQFIINARTTNGLKQVELAKRANLDPKTVADIERGGGIYNPGHINKIAKVLGVNIPRK